MDIESWQIKCRIDDKEILFTGFPTKQSAVNFIERRKFDFNDCKIIADYWEPAFRSSDGELDLHWGI